MNQIRKQWIADCANTATETLSKGTHRTISRERIQELVNIIAELFQEIEDLQTNKELMPKLADDVWAVAKKLEGTDESNDLKKISSCLHDIRAERDAEWYKKFEITT